MRSDLFGALLFASCLVFGTSGVAGQTSISLAGQWRFQLDRNDSGMRDRLFARSLPGQVSLPGTLSEQGFGDEVTPATKWIGQIVDQSYFTSPDYHVYRQPGNVKLPFWLQPEKYYAGPAWYQREIEIPQEWAGRRIALLLERPHWETRVWVDGDLIGSNNALGTPHEYDLGVELQPGRHILTVRVDNRMIIDIGENSHSISDHTQGNWNGIVGRIELSASAPVWIDDLQVYPHLATRSITVRGRLGNATGRADHGVLSVEVNEHPSGPRSSPAAFSNPIAAVQVPVAWTPSGASFETLIQLPESVRAWDEFSPVLYQLAARLDANQDSRSVSFGLRELRTEGTEFLLNGRKLFFRGTLECAIFPLTGHPPVDVESWRKIIRAAKAHGLNHIRFHSWCPPEAAFEAADELGFYYQVECSSWANGSTTLGDGKPVDNWIYEEAERILRAYGNHPSFMLMLYGNEPGGPHHKAYLARWIDHFRARDARRLYSSGAGWPELQESQFHVLPDPRIQAWGAGLKSRINSRPPETGSDYRDFIWARSVPIISHEIGQWCVYPNLEEIPKYTGYLKPKNFEIFRDRLQASGMLDQAREFLLASGKLQTLCYKEDIESALRTPGMGGFQLLDLHDFPGQGTALVGVLDPFWDSKGYVSAEEFRRFCNVTVPLARLPKRVFETGEEIEASIEVAHYGAAPLNSMVATWRLLDEAGNVLMDGRLPAAAIPIGNAFGVGRIRIPLKMIQAPARCRLVVALEGTEFENDWDFWVYPAGLEAQEQGIVVVRELDDQALRALEGGAKMLLLIPPEKVAPDPHLGKVELGFSSIFWNTAWTKRQAPHTLGILCDPEHPALAAFPTDFHSDWQWWYLLNRAGAMILGDLPGPIRPIVQVIDDWFTARRLGLVFEARVGNGSLLVSSIDLENDLGSNPVARQLRHSLLEYMRGSDFRPDVTVTAEQIRALIAGTQREAASRRGSD
jgi:hypothetical protein